MSVDPTHKPRLRPVEPFELPEEDGRMIGLRDPSGISPVVLSMSAPALQILALMDGTHTLHDIRSGFEASFGQRVSQETLHALVAHLDEHHFLEGPRFEAHFQQLQDEYRRSGVRAMPHAAALGITDERGTIFADMLKGEFDGGDVEPNTVRGIIAPHLDYPRGGPCYSVAYELLRRRRAPARVVILGTNHFGRAMSVVATACDFQTPLGTTRVDRGFLERLEERCGDLRKMEFDHVREHSVELQVAWLQHLYGADKFTIVPFLCPDPCGPSGTAPRGGDGVDLADFSRALGELVCGSEEDTLLVAGADLSHVGEAFGDDHNLTEAFLLDVRTLDNAALEDLQAKGPDAFVQRLRLNDNATRICSAGCIFAITCALAGAQPRLMRYHQAADHEIQNCVTCAAVAIVGG